MAAKRSVRLSCILCAVFLSACAQAPKKKESQTLAKPNADFTASLSPSRVVDGSLVVVNVDFARAFSGAVHASFEGTSFLLYPIDSTHYQGLFGVPHSHAPGASELRLSIDGLKPESLGLEISDAHYPSETLKVSNRKVNPTKKDLVRIRREQKEIAEVLRVETPTRYWNGAFLHPTETAITDQFGMKRLYNGQLRNYHGGMDFKAAIGTPIHASAPGVVLLAKNLFYSGGTVILDHGYGLLTMYFHMSRIGVKKGQAITAHELLGLSGKSGRVTGPHLHFQVVVHRTKVNPKDLFEEIK